MASWNNLWPFGAPKPSKPTDTAASSPLPPLPSAQAVAPPAKPRGEAQPARLTVVEVDEDWSLDDNDGTEAPVITGPPISLTMEPEDASAAGTETAPAEAERTAAAPDDGGASDVALAGGLRSARAVRSHPLMSALPSLSPAARAALAGVFALALSELPTVQHHAWARGFFKDLCDDKLGLPEGACLGLQPLIGGTPVYDDRGTRVIPPPASSLITGAASASSALSPAVVKSLPPWKYRFRGPGAHLVSTAGGDAESDLVPFLLSLPPQPRACYRILRDLLLLYLMSGAYDARVRAVFRCAAHALGVPWLQMGRAEDRLLIMLHNAAEKGGAEASGTSSADSASTASSSGVRSFAQSSRLQSHGTGKAGGTASPASNSTDTLMKVLKIGATGLVGAGLLLITGGVAAPALLAGLGALASASGVGAASAALAFLSSTAGTAVLLSAFGVTGGGLASYRMARRMDGLKTFQFLCLSDQSKMDGEGKDVLTALAAKTGVSCKEPADHTAPKQGFHVVICASGLVVSRGSSLRVSTGPPATTAATASTASPASPASGGADSSTAATAGSGITALASPADSTASAGSASSKGSGKSWFGSKAGSASPSPTMSLLPWSSPASRDPYRPCFFELVAPWGDYANADPCLWEAVGHKQAAAAADNTAAAGSVDLPPPSAVAAAAPDGAAEGGAAAAPSISGESAAAIATSPAVLPILQPEVSLPPQSLSFRAASVTCRQATTADAAVIRSWYADSACDGLQLYLASTSGLLPLVGSAGAGADASTDSDLPVPSRWLLSAEQQSAAAAAASTAPITADRGALYIIESGGGIVGFVCVGAIVGGGTAATPVAADAPAPDAPSLSPQPSESSVDTTSSFLLAARPLVELRPCLLRTSQCGNGLGTQAMMAVLCGLSRALASSQSSPLPDFLFTPPLIDARAVGCAAAAGFDVAGFLRDMRAEEAVSIGGGSGDGGGGGDGDGDGGTGGEADTRFVRMIACIDSPSFQTAITKQLQIAAQQAASTSSSSGEAAAALAPAAAKPAPSPSSSSSTPANAALSPTTAITAISDTFSAATTAITSLAVIDPGAIESRRGWLRRAVPYGESYALAFEPESLADLGDSVTRFVQNYLSSKVISEAVSHTLLSAVSVAWTLPSYALRVFEWVDSPWAIASDRSSKAGTALAHVLAEAVHGRRPVTLIGYGMGARVAFKCCEELSAMAAAQEAASSTSSADGGAGAGSSGTAAATNTWWGNNFKLPSGITKKDKHVSDPWVFECSADGSSGVLVVPEGGESGEGAAEADEREEGEEAEAEEQEAGNNTATAGSTAAAPAAAAGKSWFALPWQSAGSTAATAAAPAAASGKPPRPEKKSKSSKSTAPTLPPLSPAGIVCDLVVLGCPVPNDAARWRAVRRVVAGRVINAFCRKDLVLRVAYRLQKFKLDVAGLGPVGRPINPLEFVNREVQPPDITVVLPKTMRDSMMTTVSQAFTFTASKKLPTDKDRAAEGVEAAAQLVAESRYAEDADATAEVYARIGGGAGGSASQQLPQQQQQHSGGGVSPDKRNDRVLSMSMAVSSADSELDTSLMEGEGSGADSAAACGGAAAAAPAPAPATAAASGSAAATQQPGGPNSVTSPTPGSASTWQSALPASYPATSWWEGIENVDVTHIVTGHLQYRNKLEEVLLYLGIEKG